MPNGTGSEVGRSTVSHPPDCREMLREEHFEAVTTELFGPFQVQGVAAAPALCKLPPSRKWCSAAALLHLRSTTASSERAPAPQPPPTPTHPATTMA